MKMHRSLYLLFLILSIALPAHGNTKKITDAAGRTHHIPQTIKHTICSGAGCLRLLTYLQTQARVVGVDDIEKRRRTFDARPYALANRHFRQLPLFGEFRGHDNPELILALKPQPQVIFKTYGSAMGYNPAKLEKKTGIPVIVLDYGDLGKGRPKLFRSLRIMGDALGKSARAEEVIRFMESLIADLKKRTADIPVPKRPSVFIGGVAFKGPHGFQSTEPAYPPFSFINAKNPAYDVSLSGKEIKHSDVAKEMIVEWNPDILLLDLATLQLGDKAGGLHELRSDPAYRTLTAVQKGKVYGVLPYNWYTKNYGSILANAYFIGKLLYPDRFSDINPQSKADEIYRFLVSKPVFEEMNKSFRGLAFQPIPME
jgi:iron complex transport system substrate-binding protein